VRLPRVPHNGEHQGTEAELGRNAQIGLMGDQCFDDVPMTSVRGEHETGLAVAIPGIDVYPTSKKVSHKVDITALDGILPEYVHRPRPSMQGLAGEPRNTLAGCSKRLSSEAAASEEMKRTLLSVR
jgi:hypothetical protein